MTSPGLLAALRDVVGALTSSRTPTWSRATWSIGRHGSGRDAAVVRPASTDEVAEVLRACHAHATVVPQGGNTGLVGGSVPLHGEIVVDLRRLDASTPSTGGPAR